MIDKTLCKATAERHGPVVVVHRGGLHAMAEALCGDVPGSDRAGAEKDDGRRFGR